MVAQQPQGRRGRHGPDRASVRRKWREAGPVLHQTGRQGDETLRREGPGLLAVQHQAGHRAKRQHRLRLQAGHRVEGTKKHMQQVSPDVVRDVSLLAVQAPERDRFWPRGGPRQSGAVEGQQGGAFVRHGVLRDVYVQRARRQFRALRARRRVDPQVHVRDGEFLPDHAKVRAGTAVRDLLRRLGRRGSVRRGQRRDRAVLDGGRPRGADLRLRKPQGGEGVFVPAIQPERGERRAGELQPILRVRVARPQP
mmetsp:Transcript_1044/g.2223  ORF Transcript_1044/g.2223 Transcript_1044/m.2223 type:complete len:252 (+) Transcript_1044:398-1153(+)